MKALRQVLYLYISSMHSSRSIIQRIVNPLTALDFFVAHDVERFTNSCMSNLSLGSEFPSFMQGKPQNTDPDSRDQNLKIP